MLRVRARRVRMLIRRVILVSLLLMTMTTLSVRRVIPRRCLVLSKSSLLLIRLAVKLVWLKMLRLGLRIRLNLLIVLMIKRLCRLTRSRSVVRVSLMLRILMIHLRVCLSHRVFVLRRLISTRSVLVIPVLMSTRILIMLSMRLLIRRLLSIKILRLRAMMISLPIVGVVLTLLILRILRRIPKIVRLLSRSRIIVLWAILRVLLMLRRVIICSVRISVRLW